MKYMSVLIVPEWVAQYFGGVGQAGGMSCARHDWLEVVETVVPWLSE